MSYLRKGVSGEPVKILQAKLGVPADGVFGPATEAVLKAYQQKNGLAADGVAGPDTFLRMGLGELVLLAQGSRGEAVKKLDASKNCVFAKRRDSSARGGGLWGFCRFIRRRGPGLRPDQTGAPRVVSQAARFML